MALFQYRMTRGALYRHNCSSRDPLSARQGHYLIAHNIPEARQQESGGVSD